MYQHIVRAFKAAQHSSRAAYQQVLVMEDRVFGNDECTAVKVPLPHDDHKALVALYRRLIAKIVAKASVCFGPPDVALAIDETSVLLDGDRNIWQVIESGAEPDLDNFWRLLEAKYGPHGQKIAYGQAVAILERAFGLDENFLIKRTARQVILRTKMESCEAKLAGRERTLCDWSEKPACEVMEAMIAFATWADYAPLAACLRQFPLSETFITPQRRTFPHLDIVKYNAHWEFRVSHEAWDHLWRFVDQYTAVEG